jgi:hypothetical protein
VTLADRKITCLTHLPPDDSGSLVALVVRYLKHLGVLGRARNTLGVCTRMLTVHCDHLGQADLDTLLGRRRSRFGDSAALVDVSYCPKKERGPHQCVCCATSGALRRTRSGTPWATA